MTDPDDLVARLRAGVIKHPKRWTGDMHADLGGPIMADETDALMRDAAAEIERLRDLIGRLCVYFCECEGDDYIEADAGRGPYPRSDAITDYEALEIARYRDAARAKMGVETP